MSPKVCKRGHAYDARRLRCPACRQLARQRYRTSHASEEAARRKNWKSRNVKSVRESKWKERGIALDYDTFRDLIKRQGGRCSICQGPMRTPQVDHDHITGAVRGLLCRPCNLALGLLRDSADLCMRASRYLSDGKA